MKRRKKYIAALGGLEIVLEKCLQFEIHLISCTKNIQLPFVAAELALAQIDRTTYMLFKMQKMSVMWLKEAELK